MVITITKSGYIKSLPARHLPHAAPRRQGRDRDGHEGRGLHRAPVHLLDARLPAVLHQPRQGLPLQGLRAARGVADGQGPGAGQRAAAARGRARAVRPWPRATSPSTATSSSPPAGARSRRPRCWPTTRRSRPTASSPSTSATTTSSWRCAAPRATTTSSWSRARARRRSSPRTRCGPWAATRAACAGMNVEPEGQPRAGDGHRPARPGPARRHRERLRQAHGDGRLSRARAAARWASRRSR